MKECQYILGSKEEKRSCNAFNSILNSIQLICSEWWYSEEMQPKNKSLKSTRWDYTYTCNLGLSSLIAVITSYALKTYLKDSWVVPEITDIYPNNRFQSSCSPNKNKKISYDSMYMPCD